MFLSEKKTGEFDYYIFTPMLPIIDTTVDSLDCMNT